MKLLIHSKLNRFQNAKEKQRHFISLSLFKA